MRQLLITGTDTGVGKTITTLALASYALRYRKPTLGVMKLLACGESDLETYRRILPPEAVTLCCPQNFSPPLAPPLAAALTGQTVDLSQLWAGFQQLQNNCTEVLVEAVGGLGCPLTWDYTVADLALDWRIPVLLVAPVRLGTIGQVVTHVRYAQKLGLSIVGVVLSRTEPLSSEQTENFAPLDLLRNLCRVPILGVLPFVEVHTLENFAAALGTLDLEYLPF